jgi:hypothetical protein
MPRNHIIISRLFSEAILDAREGSDKCTTLSFGDP